MPFPPPWAAGQPDHPVVRRLCDDGAAVMAAGGLWRTEVVVERLRATWERDTPPAEWLAAVLAGDPRLWRLPDGRWLHLPAVVDGRCVTTRPDPSLWRFGVLRVGVDLVVPLLRLAGWQRIPVVTASGRGMLERARTRAGAELLVCPHDLVGTSTALLRLTTGPEGVRLADAQIDAVTDARHVRAVRRRARERPLKALEPDRSGALPRPWSVADVELQVLAEDPTARRRATAPMSDLLAELLPRGLPARRAG